MKNLQISGELERRGGTKARTRKRIDNPHTRRHNKPRIKQENQARETKQPKQKEEP